LKRVLVALIGTVALILAGCSAQDGDVRTITVVSNVAEGSFDSKALVYMGDAIEEASDGRLKFEYHFSESLVGAAETSQALADGIADMSFILPVYEPAKFPISNWAASLATVGTPTAPAGLIATAGAQAEWASELDELQAEYEDAGLKLLLNPQTLPSYNLLCTSPVTTLAEAEGKRVRVGGSAWAEDAKALGMVPVQLTGGEMYEALQRGTIDCVMVHPEAMVSASLWDVAKHYTSVPLTGWNAYFVAVGGDFWESLSEEDKEAFDVGTSAWLEGYFKYYQEDTLAFFEGAVDQGVTIHDPADDMLDAVEEHHEKVRADLIANAPEQLSDPAAAVDRRVELDEEHYAMVSTELGLEEYASFDEWLQDSGGELLDLTEWITWLQGRFLEVTDD